MTSVTRCPDCEIQVTTPGLCGFCGGTAHRVSKRHRAEPVYQSADSSDTSIVGAGAASNFRPTPAKPTSLPCPKNRAQRRQEAAQRRARNRLKSRSQEPERVLCAAIYIDTGTDDPPRRSYTYPKTGLVFSGWRHSDCYTTLNAWLARLPKKEIARLEKIHPEQTHGHQQGFLTSKGRFVDRFEGGRIAYHAGQLLPEHAASWKRDLDAGKTPFYLTSEWLY